MHEIEENFAVEAANYQDTIDHLQDEIQKMKEEMAHHLHEYQDLLNGNMAFDIKIATYRKLLECKNRISLPLPNFSSLNLKETNLHSFPLIDTHSERTLLIKTVETRDGQVINKTSQDHYLKYKLQTTRIKKIHILIAFKCFSAVFQEHKIDLEQE